VLRQPRRRIGGGSQSSNTEANPMASLTPEQAKEFHEQFKVTYSAFVGLAAVAHLLVFATKPWF
jgi:light-harvesting complex 1 beta chain